MLKEHIPLRTTKYWLEELTKVREEFKVSQAWLLRYLLENALENLDPDHLDQAIAKDGFANERPPRPKKKVTKVEQRPKKNNRSKKKVLGNKKRR